MGLLEKQAQSRVYLAVLIAAPLLIFLLNRNWPFEGFGDYDSFYYFGFFIHYPHYQILRSGYPGERLPWILPGYALVHLFGAVYGTLILHLLCFYASTLSVYSIVSRFTSAQAGFLAAFALSIHPYFLAANALDYVAGCLACNSIVFALLVRSASMAAGRRWALQCLEGVFWAAAIFMYPPWALFTPACLFVYWAARQSISPGDSIRSAIPFAIGCGALTLAMMAVHYRIFHEGGLAFQKNSIATARFINTMKQNPWSQTPRLVFLSYADWLVFPGAAAGIALLALWPRVRRWLALRPGVSLLALAYLWVVAVMIGLTIHEMRILEFDYFANILVPGAFLIFGVTILDITRELDRRWFWTVVAIVALISLAPLLKPGLFIKPPIMGAVLPGMILGSALVICLLRPWSTTAVLVMALGFAQAAFCLAPAIGGIARIDRRDWKSATARVAEVVTTVEKRLPWDKYPAFWYSERSPNNLEFQAIMCAFLAGGDSMLKFPEVPDGRRYPHGQVLVLLADRPDVFTQAASIMEPRGMPLSFLWQERIASGGTEYWVTAAQIR